MGETTIIIGYLADYPEMIPTCASWAYGQWGCQSNGSLEHTMTRFTKGANKERLPFTLVALLDNQKPVGMISLWKSDLDNRPDLSPWLSSLFVHPFYRGRHIGSILIEKLEVEARRLGYLRLFLVTEEAKNLYTRHGWEELEQVKTSQGNASLMSKGLL
jgi:GNAT superfamily N-acetyltransferase